MNCQHKGYCTLCRTNKTVSVGNCLLEKTDIKELPLLRVVKSRVERDVAHVSKER